MLRPALLTAFLGYLLVTVALLLDIGKPWYIWHPMVMWNHRLAMLYGVSAYDPSTIAGVAGTLVIVTILAAMVPALRAATTDPIEALRAE